MAIKVGFFDYGDENPFQKNFFGAVESKDFSVTPIKYSKTLRRRNLSGFDIVHFDWLHPHYKHRNWLARKVKLLATIKAIETAKPNQKFVHTFHNIISHNSFMSEASEKQMVNSLLIRMDCIFGFTNATLYEMHKAFPKTKLTTTHVIPHGHYINNYDTAVSQPESRARLGLAPDSPWVLFFGGLRENKGIEDLLDVFPLVHSETGAKLLVAGRLPIDSSSSLRKKLEQPSSWLNYHHQFIPDSDIPLYYGAADIVALPFREILNSGSAILAASMGKCCVLPQIESLTSSLCAQSLLTYRANDINHLTEVLIHATSQSAERIQQLGLASLEHARINLSWKKTGQLARDTYKEIVHK